MVKIAAKDIEAFVKRPAGPTLRAVLVYGPDRGLVGERTAVLLRGVVEDIQDPFRVVEITGAQLAADPARLADEASALAFTGGRRVLWVREAGDSLAALFKGFLADPPGEALVLLEAGDLAARSSLRKAFEGAGPAAAALPCYRDEARDLTGLVRDMLTAEGLSISRDALQALALSLGGDRQLTRREVEKLILYKGNAAGPNSTAAETGEIDLADLRAVIGDVSAYALEDIAFAVGAGDLSSLERLLARAFAEGLQPVSILRQVARHFDRLMLAGAHFGAGAAEQAALAKLRPPVFWKQRGVFAAQARAWRPAALKSGLARLIAAEADCKTTGLPAETMAARALLGLAARSPLRQKSRAA